MRGKSTAVGTRTVGWPATIAVGLAVLLMATTFLGGPTDTVDATPTEAEAAQPAEGASLRAAAVDPAVSGVSAPDSVPDPLAEANVPPPGDPAEDVLAAAPQTYGRTLTVGKGDTLIKMLVAAGVTRADAYGAVTALGEAHDPRLIRPGQAIDLTLELPDVAPAADLEAEASGEDPGAEVATDRLTGLTLTLGLVDSVVVTRTDDGFAAEKRSKPVVRHVDRATGTITSSLYNAAVAGGLPAGAMMELIRIYSWDVDFQRDIQPGDAFEVMYETYTTESGEPVRSGEVLYARLTLSGQDYPLYHFETGSGQVAHFDDKGRGAKKPLMRTPINGARLSSGYGNRRHPILGYTKKHTGVDFAAPRGTPIYAAGDGRITFRGRRGGYGNYIRIRHNGDFSTAYAHMSSFKRGLSKGSRVKQGQVIGFVGSTGRSTGPHLHYEILRGGKHVNPMRVRLPAGFSLKGKDLTSFKVVKAETDAIYTALKQEADPPAMASAE